LDTNKQVEYRAYLDDKFKNDDLPVAFISLDGKSFECRAGVEKIERL